MALLYVTFPHFIEAMKKQDGTFIPSLPARHGDFVGLRYDVIQATSYDPQFDSIPTLCT